MLKSLLIKVIAIAIGATLLIRLLSISEGIPLSIIARSAPSVQAFTQATTLNPRHGYAYQQLAFIAFQKRQYDTAKENAYKALNSNPSDGLAMAILMSIFNQEKNPELADQAAQLSAHLWPAHDTAMRLIATHWIKSKNLDKAMSAWNVILNQDPFEEELFFEGWAAKTLFPLLNRIAQVEASTQLFSPYQAKPPRWWGKFFQYMVTQPNNLKAVNRFYEQTLINNKISSKNKKLYLTNLVNENQWIKAYDVWEKGLAKDYQPYTQLMYDGSFEADLINDYFSWIIPPKSDVNVYRDKYSKAKGGYSLHITFNTWVDDYWGWLRQIMILKPGKYTVEFHTRARLNSIKGLKWRIGCLKNEKEKMRHLAESQFITGDVDWKKIQFKFTVPKSDTCKAQKLYLVTAGDESSDSRMRGDIWFDDFKITKNK